MPGSNVVFKEFNVQIGYHRDVISPYRHLWIRPVSSDDAPVAVKVEPGIASSFGHLAHLLLLPA